MMVERVAVAIIAIVFRAQQLSYFTLCRISCRTVTVLKIIDLLSSTTQIENQ
jgi:hypothetical protein